MGPPFTFDQRRQMSAEEARDHDQARSQRWAQVREHLLAEYARYNPTEGQPSWSAVQELAHDHRQESLDGLRWLAARLGGGRYYLMRMALKDGTGRVVRSGYWSARQRGEGLRGWLRGLDDLADAMSDEDNLGKDA